MLRGFSTVSYFAEDVEAAAKWYTELVGTEPYYRREGYIEFRLGDYEHELGIIDAKYAPPSPGLGGEIIYWHVDDVAGALERMLALGATEHQPLIERGEGFVTASVVDPFGNILGVMYNPHYLEILERSGTTGPAT